MTVHETAKRGFVHGDTYEAGRPGYPREAVDALRITATTAVCDLGCGTGKFTRIAHATGAHVVGVEPLPAMLAEFRNQLPDVHVLAGVAESLPLRDESFDVVVCASVFHWLRHDVALPEIHRVLRRDGRLGIVWNRRDQLTGWAAEFWSITERYRGDTPGYRSGDWRRALEGSRYFGPIGGEWFDHVQHTTVDGAVARVASISFIQTLPEAERASVLDEARRFLVLHADARGHLRLPYKTVVYTAARR